MIGFRSALQLSASRLGLVRQGGAVVVAPPAVPTSTFTMTQLPTVNRIYPRTTKTGGGQGKGQGTIPVTISGATAGTINARCRAPDGVTIVQAEFAAATIATSATVANIAGVDARLNQFYLDLLDSGGVWKNGTVLIGMGALVGIAGQSHTTAQFVLNTGNGDTSTITGNGLTINAASRAYVSIDDLSANAASTWRQSADAGPLTSTGIVELTNRLITLSGVAVGIVGKTMGNTPLSSWVSGQVLNTGLINTLTASGGRIEAFIFGIGHNDAQFNAGKFNELKDRIANFWASVDAVVAPGYQKIMFGVPNVTNDAYSTTLKTRAKVNGAFEDWARDNNGTYLSVPDIVLGTDSVHPTQVGNIRYAQHEYRAMLSALGGTKNDRGPQITGITKSGVDLTLPVNLQSGATTLVSQGTPAARFWVARRGAPTALALDATTPITVGTNTITLKLATDPGNVPIEVFPLALHPANDATASMIYDDNTDGDGITRGRTLYASPWGFDTKPNGNGTATSPTYSTTKFGGGLSAGYMAAPFPATPSEARGATIECFYKHLTNVASIRIIFSQPGSWYFGINNGALVVNGSTTGMPTLTIGQTYHLAFVIMPGNRNATVFVDGVAYQIADPVQTADIANAFFIRRLGGAGFDLGTGGEVAHVAVFRGPRYLTTFTPTTTEYTGTETDLLHLWKLQGNALDSKV